MTKVSSLLLILISIVFVHQYAYAAPIRMTFTGHVTKVCIVEELEEDFGIYTEDPVYGVLNYNPDNLENIFIDHGSNSYSYEGVIDYSLTVGSLNISSSRPSLQYSSDGTNTNISMFDLSPLDNDENFNFHCTLLGFLPVSGSWGGPHLPTSNEFMSLVPSMFMFGGDIQHSDAPMGSAGEEVLCQIDIFTHQPVPEPSTILLVGIGLIGIGRFATRRSSSKFSK
jgi:hypothetical protein